MPKFFFSFCLAALLLTLSGASGAAQSAGPIQPVLAVLVDPGGTETIESVSAAGRQKDFKTLPSSFSAGYSRKVHWLRFTLSRVLPGEPDAIVEIHPTYLKNLRLYEPVVTGEGLKYRVHQAGNDLPFGNRELPYRGFAFKVNFADRQPQVFYIRLQTTTTSLVSLREWLPETFAEENLKEYLWLGIFFGVMTTIFIINFLNWIWTGESLFRFYVIYVGMLTLYFVAVDGLAAQYIFPLQPYWVDKWISMGTLLSAACAAPFFSRILAIDPANAHRWRWLYRVLLLSPIVLLPAPFFDYYIEAAQVTVLLLSLALILGVARSCFILSKRKTLSTTFILLGHVIGLVGVLSAALTALGVLPGNFWLIYGYQVGILLEALAFSMAISVRIKEASDERQEALERVNVAEQRAESERLARNEQSRFMAMLTHELKTPMSVIRVALSSAGLGQDSVRHAEQAIYDMNNVIDRCVQVDSLEQRRSFLRVERFDVTQFINDLSFATGQSHRIALHAEAPAYIENDRQYVGIAMANLLDNAIKYAESDSDIAIFVGENTMESRAGILVRIENRPGTAGMPAADQVFRKYYRSAGAHAKTGSGLGLYLVQSMSDFVGAKIRYLPSEQLVRFDLWLPL